MEENKIPGWLTGGFIGVLLAAMLGGLWLARSRGAFDTAEEIHEAVHEEVDAAAEAATDAAAEAAAEAQQPQWTLPMQRWFQAGNRISLDFVHEEGWCAVAIQRPPEEEGGQPTVQCIK